MKGSNFIAGGVIELGTEAIKHSMPKFMTNDIRTASRVDDLSTNFGMEKRKPVHLAGIVCVQVYSGVQSDGQRSTDFLLPLSCIANDTAPIVRRSSQSYRCRPVSKPLRIR